jgi:hypothetical protein
MTDKTTKRSITKLKVRKLKGNDIKWSNPSGDQVTHFANCTENLNAENSCYDCKKTRTTFDVRPTI